MKHMIRKLDYNIEEISDAQLDQLVKDEIHTALPLDDRISMNRMIEL